MTNSKRGRIDRSKANGSMRMQHSTPKHYSQIDSDRRIMDFVSGEDVSLNRLERRVLMSAARKSGNK